jgi:ATP-dependent helicase/nuclease subunit B
LSADGVVDLIPYGADPLQALTDRLLQEHAERLPDLSHCVVLFPHAGAIPRFHRVLLQRAAALGHEALLPPECGTLEGWATRHAPRDRPTLPDTARESLFFDALQQHPELKRRFGTWPLIDSLLRLFDEITLEQCPLPDDPAHFHDLIAAGYGPGSRGLAPLSDEAALVHSLWRAWREQLEAARRFDRPLQYLAALAHVRDALPDATPVYAMGFVAATRAESDWMQQRARRRGITILLQGRSTTAPSAHPDIPVTECLRLFGAPAEIPATPFSQFLDHVYAAHAAPLRDRAREQAIDCPESPARERLRLFEAGDAEAEARAIALQLRRWKLAGKTHLGIVTADRRLARRVRALLERAGIGVLDAAGWALSTTSAATVVARWIECIDEGFHHDALLDLLRSPFLTLDPERPAGYDAVIDSFERDIVQARNIRRGLAPLRAAADNDTLRALLDRIDEAARPLAGALANHERPGREFVRALRASLDRLGVLSALARDDAGREVLAALDELESAYSGARVTLHWDEFVRWLERTFERRRFQPRLRGTGVELMSFAESRLYHFDALIVGAADARHLPGAADAPPLFNDGVRARLGLPGVERRYNTRFYDFRRLLEAAPDVLVTFRREECGETLAPSPWVECLRAFHVLAYADPLDDPELRALARHPETVIAARTAPRPEPLHSAAANLPPGRLPEKFFASAWQSLIDCPFQFLCRYGLGLPPAPETREEMEGSDFGQRVHRILEAFHGGTSGLPGPFRAALTLQTLPQARELMRSITAAAFASDLRQSRLTQVWIHRWLDIADAYLDWQCERGATWRVQRTEASLARTCVDGPSVTIAGRIDRIDVDAAGRLALIDYKTGAVPKTRDVAEGEALQLPLYALLPEQPVAEATYLELGREGLKDRPRLAGDELVALTAATRARLQHLKESLDRGSALPANGDDATCARCTYMGLCRRQHWAVAVTPAAAGTSA